MVRKVGDGPVSRVHFHAKMLNTYFLRWLGFCKLKFIHPPSLLENTLFLHVDVASRIAAKDVRKLTPIHDEVRLAWARYAESLAALNHSPSKQKSAEETYKRLKEFVETLGKCF
jgi:hypothetical protein